MEGIELAVRHAVEAGKLREYCRLNGSGLRGLERLADRHTQAATAALAEALAGQALAGLPLSD